MKQQVAVSMAGLMLLTAGCENADGKTPFSALVAGMQGTKSEKVTPQNVGEKNIHNQWQGRSSPSLYDGGFFARADFLYWRADEEGLQYVSQTKIDATASNTSSDVFYPNVKWDPGFRVGIGYTFSSQDYWDLMALWTHFQTHQTGSKSITLESSNLLNSTVLIPWWGGTLLGGFASAASTSWKLNYNTYDLDLGRNYFVAKTLSVHPFIGVRGATVKQSHDTTYEAILLSSQSSLVPTAFKADTKFWGVGAHIGTGLQWRCTPCFSVLGNVGGSLLYGNYKLNENYNSFVVMGGSEPLRRMSSNTQDHFSKGTVNLEAMIGFQWEKFFYQNKYRLSITAGYEWSEWFSQNQITKVEIIPDSTGLGFNSFTRANGDLTLQGANLQVRWDF